MNAYVAVEVQNQSFLTSAWDTAELSAPDAAALPRGKKH